jgi:hypothetical protein
MKGKIGCEIECVIPTTKLQLLGDYCLSKGWNIGYDGSIRNEPHCSSREFKVGVYDVKDINTMTNDLKQAFKMIRVNNSCGLHIHLSFESISDYYKLLNYNFILKFQDTIRKNFKSDDEIKRLTNHYCKFYSNEKEFKVQTNNQLKSSGKGYRYFIVNYNSFNQLKTIEFRVFAPTTSITKFKSYLKLLFKSIDDYLKEAKIEPINRKIKKDNKLNNEPMIISEIITKQEILSLKGGNQNASSI